MSGIVGQYDISVKINGVEYKLEIASIRTLAIYESANELLPTFELQLFDPLVNRDLLPVYDGCKIELLIQPTTEIQESQGSQFEGQATWVPFRVFKAQITSHNEIDTFLITGYYDAPSYIINAGFGYHEGNSVSIARTIANAAGLQFDGDVTNDSQVWYPSGRSGGAFLAEVTKHAWRDNQSAYVTCVTKEGELRFYNVGDRRNRESMWTMVYGSPMIAATNQYEVVVTSVFSNPSSGILNRWRGYGIAAGNDDMINGNYHTVNLGSLQKTTDKLAINSELAKPTRYQAGPIDIGNTHPNYFTAQVQNERILSTFSDHLKCMTNRPKKVNLLDRCTMKAITPPAGTLRMDYSGDYFISHIATFLLNGNIIVTYTLTKEGVNAVSGDVADQTRLL